MNVDKPILALDGTPVVENGKPVTVATVAVNALLASNEGTGDQKAARYRLALKLSAGGDPTLDPEDLVSIKAAVGAGYLPLVVGQVYDWCSK